MRLLKTILFLSCAWLMTQGPPASAQTYALQVLNQTVVGSTLQFDIYLLRTGTTPIYLGDCDFVLTFNNSNFNNPTAVVNGEGLSGWYTIVAEIRDATKFIVNVKAPPFSTQTQFNQRVTNISATQPNGEWIGTFQITDMTNPNGTSGLQWRDVTPNATIVQTLANTSPWTETNITNPAFHVSPSDIPLPIQLTSFAASVVRDNDVEVAWKTVSETNNYGFEIYRKRGETGDWKKIAFVDGHGTTLTPQSYSHVDREVAFGKYSYQIKQIDLDGNSKAFPESDVTVGIAPGTFIVGQNYPNPFNPSTAIEFVVPQNGLATMKVYNVLGQEVATLFEGSAEASKIYTVNFNGSDLASGLYFYMLSSAGKVQTKRMLMMK